MTAGAHHHFKHSIYYVEPDREQWEYWQSCVMNKPGCLSILARRAPRRAVALWKPCIVFLSCARARFLWRCSVKRWPSASCKSHGDGPATSPGASPAATEQPPSLSSVCLSAFKSFSTLPSLFPPTPFSPFTSLKRLLVLFYSHFLHPSPPTSIFSYSPPPVCPSPPYFPLSTPLFLFASLLPSSLCPTVQVRRGSVRRFLCKLQVQTTPCEGDFCYCQWRPTETRRHACSCLNINMELLYILKLYSCFWQ